MNAESLLRSLWSQWIRPVVIPGLAILAAKSALADINYVPSGSMQPTILSGDVVFVNKLAYDLRVPFTFARLGHWADPARGDIVVCFKPTDGIRLVKRLVAVPGDTIELRDDVLFLNGARQSCTRAAADAGRYLPAAERRAAVFATENLTGRSHAIEVLPSRPARCTFGPVKLGPGQYFAMGDNRDNSEDSRYFGPIPRSQIIGRAVGVVASFDLDRYLQPRFDRFGSGLE
jgi:signal peptidase I